MVPNPVFIWLIWLDLINLAKRNADVREEILFKWLIINDDLCETDSNEYFCIVCLQYDKKEKPAWKIIKSKTCERTHTDHVD